MSRVGIFSGSFDPVHKGHIAFALAAIEAANLDSVYFAPEAKPRRKDGVSHFAHRVAMLELAVAAHPKLGVLELPDKNFSVGQTLPRLKAKFKSDQLFYLCGSDMLEHMPSWPLIESLLNSMGLIVGVRDDQKETDKLVAKLPVGPQEVFILPDQLPTSSHQIRSAIANHKPTDGLLPSTIEYINKNWLYSVAPSKSS